MSIIYRQKNLGNAKKHNGKFSNIIDTGLPYLGNAERPKPFSNKKGE